MVLDESDYSAGNQVQKLMTTFINKYQKLAVKVDPSLFANVFDQNDTLKISKVPGQQIYIFEGQGKLTLKQLGGFTKPFTMIIKGLDLVVKGSFTSTHGMFLVDG